VKEIMMLKEIIIGVITAVIGGLLVYLYTGLSDVKDRVSNVEGQLKNIDYRGISDRLSKLEGQFSMYKELQKEIYNLQVNLKQLPTSSSTTSPADTATTIPQSAGTLPIRFTGFHSFGSIQITTSSNRDSFSVSGASNGYSGYTKIFSFQVGARRNLMVRVTNSDNSNFVNMNKMLKVIASVQDIGLRSTANDYISDDPEFIYKGDGVFTYSIPDSLVLDGVINKIGFVFGPGNINNLKIEAWFQ
jgi:hypothetical protein